MKDERCATCQYNRARHNWYAAHASGETHPFVLAVPNAEVKPAPAPEPSGLCCNDPLHGWPGPHVVGAGPRSTTPAPERWTLCRECDTQQSSRSPHVHLSAPEPRCEKCKHKMARHNPNDGSCSAFCGTYDEHGGGGYVCPCGHNPNSPETPDSSPTPAPEPRCACRPPHDHGYACDCACHKPAPEPRCSTCGDALITNPVGITYCVRGCRKPESGPTPPYCTCHMQPPAYCDRHGIYTRQSETIPEGKPAPEPSGRLTLGNRCPACGDTAPVCGQCGTHLFVYAEIAALRAENERLREEKKRLLRG